MLILDRDKISQKMNNNRTIYASVCNSCACGGGISSCNTTCKGCKDKNENVAEVRKAYTK